VSYSHDPQVCKKSKSAGSKATVETGMTLTACSTLPTYTNHNNINTVVFTPLQCLVFLFYYDSLRQVAAQITKKIGVLTWLS